MTTIAFCQGFLAADKQATHNGTGFTTSKIKRLTDGRLLAYSGHVLAGEAMCDWYVRHASDPREFPQCVKHDGPFANMLVVEDKETVLWFGGAPCAQVIMDPFFALGTGRDVALGAMHAMYYDFQYRMGSVPIAKRAIEIAIRWDTETGLGVDCYEARDVPQK